eukprot:3188509-Amphidinium_carterae.1
MVDQKLASRAGAGRLKTPASIAGRALGIGAYSLEVHLARMYLPSAKSTASSFVTALSNGERADDFTMAWQAARESDLTYTLIYAPGAVHSRREIKMASISQVVVKSLRPATHPNTFSSSLLILSAQYSSISPVS